MNVELLSHIAPGVCCTIVQGGAAGDITVNGIKAADTLLSVQMVVTAVDGTYGFTVTNASGADRTSEFSITADNTINNTGGTTSANNKLVVCWARTAASGVGRP